VIKKLLIMSALLLPVGCGSLNESYVVADEETYEAIAPEYEGLVRSGYQFDPDGNMVVDDEGKPILLSDERREVRLRTVRSWEYRITQAKSELQRQELEAE
jgi:hypothetical protein